jgi:isopenicillin-N epimerase
VASTVEASNPLWGDGWPELRSQWLLDPDMTFLNHGSFGATPRPVLDRQDALRTELEREPVAFMYRLPEFLAACREEVAAFLGADADGCAFVTNATTGVATVLASLDLRPGERLVTTDHAYGAVRNAMRVACERAGASFVEVHVPLPLPPDEVIAAAVGEALDDGTRLVVVDHVTSPTAVVFPVRAVVDACRRAGVAVMVDSAHGPGMLPIEVTALGADFWTGNLHKWVCAPKGSAVLWVAPEHRERVHPLVTSHGAGQGFRAEFDWTGTHDPTPYLSAPAALSFMSSLGWDRIREHNHRLSLLGREAVAAAAGTGRLVDDDRIGSMCVVALPEGVATDDGSAFRLESWLRDERRIEVPVIPWAGRGFLRLSAQVYNAPADYERLAAAIAAAAGSVGENRRLGAQP